MKLRSSTPYRWREGDYEVVRSICWSPPGCHGGCGVLLYTKNGKLYKVEGDSDNHFNRGRLCVRGLNIKEMVYHPQRLKYPLLRAGARGQNKWKRISWQEAEEIISRRLLEIKNGFGSESVIFCKGTARDIGGWLPQLCYGFGSPNYFGFGPAHGNACYRPRVAVSTAVLGAMPVPDLGQFHYPNSIYNPPKCILIWGSNPVHTHPDGIFGGWITDLMRKGIKLMVADPQLNFLSSNADIWLRLKPGTDGALALGMINVILRENLFDVDFCRKWVSGLEELRAVANKYPPSKVAQITGVKEELIVSAARFYTEQKPASIIWGVSLDMHPHCVGAIHSLISLMVLTGNIDNPGGMLLLQDPFGVKRRGDDISTFPNIKIPRIGADKYPLIEIGNPYAHPDALLEQLASGKPYPIKAAWIQGAGIIPSGFVQPKKVIQLFNSLNLIIIVDIFLNPAAVALADIILPAAMYTEKNSLYVHFSQVGAINQALSPPGECKSDAEIILSVGKKIASEYFPWKNVLEWIDYRLQPGGIDFAELRMVSALKPSVSYARFAEGLLRSDKKTGFQTPSAKIELFSQVLKNCNLNPLPYYESSFEYKDKQQNQDYPYILTTGVRKPYFFCMEWRNSPSLRHYQSDPEVCINPEDAKLREISNGDWIKIYTPYGKCQMKARVCNRFPVGVIHCDSGWWFPEKKPERLFDIGSCNVNALFPLGLTGSSGLGFPFRSYFCNIEKSIS